MVGVCVCDVARWCFVWVFLMGAFRLLRLASRVGIVMACCQRPYPCFLWWDCWGQQGVAQPCVSGPLVFKGEGDTCGVGCLRPPTSQAAAQAAASASPDHLVVAASAWLAGFWAGWLLSLLFGWLAVALVGCCPAAVWLAAFSGGWWLVGRLFRKSSCWLKSRPAAIVAGCGAVCLAVAQWLSGCGVCLVGWPSVGCLVAGVSWLVLGGLLGCAGVGRSVGSCTPRLPPLSSA